MATTKKKTPASKAVKAAPKAVKKAVKKVASAVKPAPKKKPATKAAPKAAPKTSSSREHKAASTALKLVDEAAGLLRKGINVSADTTEKTRLAAKQRAHTLLTKASSSLGGILSDSASVLHKAINKI